MTKLETKCHSRTGAAGGRRAVLARSCGRLACALPGCLRFARTPLVLARVLLLGSVLAGCGSGQRGSSGKIMVVAAENEYGAMAEAIGGKEVRVTSLLSNPNTDPHEFEARTSTAETVARAQLVIMNGIGYDSWMNKLLSASPRTGRLVFSVGEALGKRAGDNPHVWYESAGWPVEAATITRDLTRLAPRDARYFAQRKLAWLRQLQPVYREIARVRRLTRGSRVIATEPVYGYMIATLGATSLDAGFQKATMDGTDPSPRAVAAFETDLRRHRVRLLFYNSQVIDPTTTEMRGLAAQSGVPVVGVTETQPPASSFVGWQISQLQAVAKRWK